MDSNNLGFFIAAVALLINAAVYIAKERETKKRLEEQSKLEALKVQRSREENTGKHLIATSDAFSAYKHQVESENFSLRTALDISNRKIDDLTARVQQLEIERDEHARMMLSFRLEIEDLRRAILSSHSTQADLDKIEELAKRIQ